MGSIRIVAVYPDIQVNLQFFQRVIQFAPESNLVKLMEDSFKEALADAVCLRMPGLGFCMFDAIYAR
jgi:hypothetical protein